MKSGGNKKPKVPTWTRDGVLYRGCHVCGTEIVYDQHVTYCQPCRKEKARINLEMQKRFGARTAKIHIECRGGVPYRQCARCFKWVQWQPKRSYCRNCARIVDYESRQRRKERGLPSASTYVDSARRSNRPPPEQHFKSGPMSGLFTGCDESVVKAMVAGDFKAFMRATEDSDGRRI